MRFVCVSDTHSLHWRISDISGGDVLIHAGDCLGAGTLENVEDLNDWLGTLPHRHKIVIKIGQSIRFNASATVFMKLACSVPILGRGIEA